MMYWDQQIFQFEKKANEIHNLNMKKMLLKIREIPDHIKMYVLKRYLSQTQILQMIHFYNQRKQDPTLDVNVEEIDNLIRNVQDHIIEGLQTALNHHRMSKATAKVSKMAAEDLRAMGLSSNVDQADENPAFINSFQEIGWVDPFKIGDKDKGKAVRTKNLMTDSITFIDSLLYEDRKVVTTLALPNKVILFKIMRACLSVQTPKDLWIYSDENDDDARKNSILDMKL